MLTGVLNLQVDDLFSAMNQQYDVSLNPRFSALCGFTQSELENTFARELASIDLTELKKRYHGHHWIGENVYHLTQILLFLDKSHEVYQKNAIEPVVANFLKSQHLSKNTLIEQLNSTPLNNQQLTQAEIHDLNPFAILFQTGYLTIDKMRVEPSVCYTLKPAHITG